MSRLSPQTLTHGEQRAILRATARNSRDHLIYSLASGTGLRLAEIVGLNVGDVYTLDGTPRTRIQFRPEIAQGGKVQQCVPAGFLGGEAAKVLRIQAPSGSHIPTLGIGPMMISGSSGAVSRRLLPRWKSTAVTRPPGLSFGGGEFTPWRRTTRSPPAGNDQSAQVRSAGTGRILSVIMPQDGY